MDVLEEREETKRCFKPRCELLDNLNVIYNETSSLFMFWNKYQIFAFEGPNFEFPSKIFNPEFNLRQIVNCNNYLVCLDTTGNIHISSLKFKNSAQKRFKSSFQPREQGVLCCKSYTTDTIIALKYEINFILYLYQIHADLQIEKRILLKLNENSQHNYSSHDKYLLFTYNINREDYDVIKGKFNSNDCVARDHSIVLISFDKITVYGFLFSPKMPEEEIILHKLYTSPIEICDIKVIENSDINVVIGLTTGTLIKIPLKHASNVEEIHLNRPLSKFITSNPLETIIYTDGLSLWKSEKSLSKEIKLSQFFLKQIKDFMKFGDSIICTTYSKCIYAFSVEDEEVYLKQDTNEYCEAEKILNNSEYFYSILQDLKKNDELSVNINKESSYLVALALSKRADVMDKSISYKVSIYDEYQDAIRENPNITLTEELMSYFESETFFVYVKLTAIMVHQMFNKVLSHLFGDLKIHVNLISNDKLIKTTSIKLSETLKKVELLLPFHVKNIKKIAELKVVIKIVVNIPGSLKSKQTIWVILYRKQIVFNSEHFIKNSVMNLATYKSKESKEELILQTALNHHGEIFKFTDLRTFEQNKIWSLYVKLPDDYTEVLKTEDHYKTALTNYTQKKLEYFIKCFTSEEFLKSTSKLEFYVGNQKIVIEIEHNFFKPILKVTGNDLNIVYNFRNFMANIIYGNYKNYSPNEIFVGHAVYTSIENIQKSIKNALVNELVEEEFLSLFDKFYRTIYGEIPL